MSLLPIVHDKFTIERIYDATPAEVFSAWSDPRVKSRWFIGPESWRQTRRELDFRTGGEEVLCGEFPSGMTTSFVARYYEIEPNQRVVYVYDMHLSGKHHSLSLATVEFRPDKGGTRMIFTEAVAFLDETENAAARERGTAAHFDRIPSVLRI
jgi:uncharacterized protein YndB with AHSA1/START domain